MNENLVKVYFDLEDETESLWAEPCFNSDSRTTFKLRNSPFAVKGISFCDIVYAVPREMSGGYEFREVVARGGHSTIRVFENNEARGAFDVYWPRLEALGCSYEGSDQGHQPLYVIDLPEISNIRTVRAILNEGERKELWTVEEAHIGPSDTQAQS